MGRLQAGVTVASYRIESVIGEGGMGVVYRAIDTRLNRAVAIKFLSSEVATPSERRRFQQEAQTASSLNHPHILTVYDAGEYDSREYLVTELADGGTLTDWTRAAKRNWRDAAELLAGIADALAAAHDAGILHRDVKPDNVLLTKSGYAKLADFGLARQEAAAQGVTRPMSVGQTKAGTVLGTAAYMSPEQASGLPIDARSDIFSFGLVLYEASTGRRPFGGTSTIDVLHAIVHDPPAPLPTSLPDALRVAIAKALEKDPADRYQSMRDLAVDLRRVLRQSAVGGVAPADARARTGRVGLIVAAAVVAVVAVAGVLWFRSDRHPSRPQVEYSQLTNFADSVVAPAISRDGRILAFIRGENTFVGPGEVYVKMLPDGEPAPLTHDGSDKMGPLVFSPDGSRINYTVGNTQAWSVPILGGEPTRMLVNAGALSWVDPANPGARRVLFSALTGEGIHMGLFTANENRGEERPVYLPVDVNGMAHRSFVSPDRKSVIVVEMDMLGWRPCTVVPFDGSGPGRIVGPAHSQCTDAAWSPDGAWVYVSANAGGGYHIWRQRYPDGVPEQVTSGATEEQGIAFDPSGQSFVTSIGETQSTLWVHAGDTRQVTFEGFAYLPSFTLDGKRLFYLQRSKADRRFVSGELWTIELTTGKRERLLPDTLMEHYDVSGDGQHLVFIDVDASGHSSIWDAKLDGSRPPHRLSSLEGIRALFGPGGDIFFVGGEATGLYLYRADRDGSNVRRVIEKSANFLYDISPDGKWLAAWVGAAVEFYPVDGGRPIVLCQECGTAGEENRGVTPSLVRWSKNGRFLYLHSTRTRRTYEVPLRQGEVVPRIPSEGFRTLDQAADALGGKALADPRPFVGSDAATYAFPRVTTHRNIYRITLR